VTGVASREHSTVAALRNARRRLLVLTSDDHQEAHLKRTQAEELAGFDTIHQLRAESSSSLRSGDLSRYTDA
jgi:hypothetical protein